MAQNEWPQNKSHEQTGNAAEVVSQRVAMTGKEHSIPHDMQMEERRDRRKNADRKRSSSRYSRAHRAMSQPIEQLSESGYAENHEPITENSRAKPERALLQCSIDTGGESDIRHFHQRHGASVRARGVGHRRNVHHRACARAEKCTLPVPARKHLRQEGGAMNWGHASILEMH